MAQFTHERLAQAVAAELGGEVARETAKLIRGEGCRSLGITESLAIGAFILQTTQLAIQFYGLSRDRATLATKLEAEAPRHQKVDSVKRERILSSIIHKLYESPAG